MLKLHGDPIRPILDEALKHFTLAAPTTPVKPVRQLPQVFAVSVQPERWSAEQLGVALQLTTLTVEAMLLMV
jgi:hypothetical protein